MYVNFDFTLLSRLLMKNKTHRIASFLLILICSLLFTISVPARDKVVICIHGMGNKSPKDTIEKWWKLSVLEGIEGTANNQDFKLKMVYWADLFYAAPLHNNGNKVFDKSYNIEPYMPAKPEALKGLEKSWYNTMKSQAIQRNNKKNKDSVNKKSKPDFSFAALAASMNDIAFYFNDYQTIKNRQGKQEQARKIVNNEVKKMLIENKDKDILFISHSMGTVIAYGALLELQKEHPEIKINQFVTMGSPLGIPPMRGLLMRALRLDTLVVPENILNPWYNLSDQNDKTAFEPAIHYYFTSNSKSAGITDLLVKNNYINPSGKHNYHKEYGYLRTPELAKIISKFLCE